MTFGEFFDSGELLRRDMTGNNNPVNLVRRREPILGERGCCTLGPSLIFNISSPVHAVFEQPHERLALR